MYIQLLFESFTSSTLFLLLLFGQPAYFAMEAFGGFDMHLAALAGFAGAALAQPVNYLAGWLILYLKRQGVLHLDESIYGKGQRLCSRWLLPLLLLSWIPFGALIAVIAAFFNVPLKHALPLLIAGQAGYWLFLVLSA